MSVRPDAGEHRVPWLVVLLFVAATLRIAHASTAWMPSNDGSHYLALAREFARGEFHGVTECVFHPGSALLPALLVRLGCDPFVAARCVAVACSTLSVLVIHAAARRLVAGSAPLVVAGLFATSCDAVRLVGEAYSEPTYGLCAGLVVLATFAGHAAGAGLALGAAFWMRPEALGLAPLLWLVPRRGGALAWAALACASLPLARVALGGTFVLTTKLGFIAPMGPFGEAGAGEVLAHLGRNLLLVPREAFGNLSGPACALGLFGLIHLRRGAPRAALAGLLVLAIGVVAMVALQVKQRFFQSYLPLLLPLAAVGLEVRLVRWVAGLAIVANLVLATRDLVAPPRLESFAERQLGESLRREGLAPADLVTDLPRVAYHAGLHPPQPVEWSPELLRPLLAAGRARYVVLGIRREGREALMQEFATRYERLDLTPHVPQEEGRPRLGLWRQRE